MLFNVVDAEPGDGVMIVPTLQRGNAGPTALGFCIRPGA